MNRTVFSLPAKSEYLTNGGLAVARVVEQFTGGANRLDDLIALLDRRRGVVLSSGTTVPGRYESFDLGFADPPLVLETSGTDFSLQALNPRGEVLIAFLGDVLREPCVVISERSATRLAGHIIRGEAPVEEDQRTRRASVMSLVRDMVAAFTSNADPLLGLFGAFAYDLVFQIEDLVQKRAREADQRDIVLYVPDRLLAYDRATGRGVALNYEFAWKGKSTAGQSHETAPSLYAKTDRQGFADHAAGEYQATVEVARAAFAPLGLTPTEPEGAQARERWQSLNALVDLVEEIVRTREASNLQEVLVSLNRRAEAKQPPAVDGVTLASLHAAKGLEWDAVFLVGLVENTLPISHAIKAGDEEIEEERRLFYVGITRAREHLKLSWSLARQEGGNKNRSRSRFLDGLVPELEVEKSPQRLHRSRACRVCGNPLDTPAEKSLGRHADCEPDYNEELFAALKRWRLDVSRAAGQPAYLVFSDATLLAITEAVPTDVPSLLAIPGVGPVKVEHYGEDVLSVVAEFL